MNNNGPRAPKPHPLDCRCTSLVRSCHPPPAQLQVPECRPAVGSSEGALLDILIGDGVGFDPKKV